MLDMSETLLQKLEEKMMMVLAEVEVSRSEISRLSQENAVLKAERENNSQKLHGLISLLDTMNLVDNAMQNVGVPIGKPVLVQA
jgi:regulator of replication initiation timing